MQRNNENIPKGNHESTLFIYGRLFATRTESVLKRQLVWTRTLKGQMGPLPEGDVLGGSGQHGDLTKETSLFKLLSRAQSCCAAAKLLLTHNCHTVTLIMQYCRGCAHIWLLSHLLVFRPLESRPGPPNSESFSLKRLALQNTVVLSRKYLCSQTIRLVSLVTCMMVYLSCIVCRTIANIPYRQCLREACQRNCLHEYAASAGR